MKKYQSQNYLQSKKIRKNGKVQKVQSPGVHKMKFKHSHKIADEPKTLQLNHQIYHVTPKFLTLESLRVIVQKWT